MSTEDLRTGEGWLKAVADVSTPVDTLEAALEAWRTGGAVLVPYAAAEMLPAPQMEKVHWTAQYFHRQIGHAGHNFSSERAEHLLRVRAHLEQLGAAGFVRRAVRTPLAKDEASAEMVVAAFSPSPSLTRALATADIGIIRSALVLELADARLSGAYLQAAMALAADQQASVFVPFEEGRFKAALNGDRATWSAQYHDDQVVFLDANFSIERFLHVVDVREHLRMQGASGFSPAAPAPTALPAGSGSADRAADSRTGGVATDSMSSDSKIGVAERIFRLLAAGLAALAAYFRGGRR